MAIPGYPVTQILTTDTFKDWADKCNDVITAIDSTTFITDATGVTLQGSQTITGVKTFSSSGGINVLGGSFNAFTSQPIVFNGTGTLTIGTTKSLIIDGPVQIRNEITFEKDATTETFGFNGAADALVSTVPIEASKLSNTGTTIGLRSIDYTLPASGAAEDSFLQSDASNNLTWSAVSDVTTSVINSLSAANFTLPLEVIPVGTIIEVDSNVLDAWDGGGPPYGEDAAYPGWRVCDGSTISYDQNTTPEDTEYEKLVRLLNETVGGVQTSGNATLPDMANSVVSPSEATTFLIKAKSDPALLYTVTGGDGVTITPNNDLLTNTFDIEGGDIALNVDGTDFTFNSGVLTLDNVTDEPTASTVVKRDAGGRSSFSDPVDDDHVATKGYVDDADNPGTVRALTDGGTRKISGFNDRYGYNRVLIDKNSNPRVYGFHSKLFNELGPPFPSVGTTTTLATGTRIPVDRVADFDTDPTDYDSHMKRIIKTRINTFVVDEDDVLYGVGSTAGGQLGVKTDLTNDRFEPAMVPSVWGDSYVTIDNISYSGDDVDENSTIANTQQNVARQVLIKTKTTGGTHGQLIVAANNNGKFGNGSSGTQTTNVTGPTKFEAGGAGRNLWQTLGDGTATSFNDQVADTSEYYVKNFFINTDSIFVIVGTDAGGDASNQLWSAGNQHHTLTNATYTGGGGRGATTISQKEFAPVCGVSTETVAVSSVTVPGGETGTVFTTAAAHGLNNYDVLANATYATTNSPTGAFTVIIGDEAGANTTTKFRLYDDVTKAYLDDVTPGSNGIVIGSSPTFNIHRPLTGVVDFDYGGIAGSHFYYARTTDNKLYSWGRNKFGGTGLSETAERVDFAKQSAENVSEIYGTNGLLGLIKKTDNKLYACGLGEYGAGGIKQAGVASNRYDYTKPVREWTASAGLPGGYNVTNVFVLAGEFGPNKVNGPTLIASNDSKKPGSTVPGVFVVMTPVGSGKSKLYAAGFNYYNMLGLGWSSSDHFWHTYDGFVEVPFPENPENIVSVSWARWETLILCKDDPADTTGRLYKAGVSNTNYSDSFQYSAGLQTPLTPYYTDWNRYIL